MGSKNLREVLGAPAHKEKGPQAPDGFLSVTPDPPEAVEWRNKSFLDVADSSFLDEAGKHPPNELFGKFTWRIENFSEIGKRELRSQQFDVGEYKWYILVYPQGCDVCNHLSLFLCVADYDKLLPGWSHFAQFTIAVVNKDPKKSKYSDTLHRFCKKEHDWGWKKFMELSKVLDGFTVADTLVIKAQVQVILDRPSRPFRCLDAQYRRELVRVYLTNVESICRRFCEDRRQRLAWLADEGASFAAWWRSLSGERRKQLTTEKGEAILKGVVKQFFNEKEVTSTLVMDALFCGCRQLEMLSRKKGSLPEGSPAPCVVINGKAVAFNFALDALEVVAQLTPEFIPALPNDKAQPVGADGLGLRSGCDEMSELRRDALERDEKRLAELGRRTVEMYALAHIFTERLERAYRDHQAEKRMKDLIAEEEEAERLQDERAAARAAADKEKRAKKKERQKAKKEADKAKKDAEEAERARQEQEKRAEIERRVAVANERRRQDELEAALQLKQQQLEKRQQELDAKAAALRKQQKQQNKQQALANGHVSTAEQGHGSAHSHEQQPGSSDSGHGDADRPSSSTAAAPAATANGRGPAAGSKYSSSSSPAAPASLADDTSEVTSVSDLDDSSSMEVGSSRGFTPVLGRHASHHHHQQQQQQQQQPQGPSSARGSTHGSASQLQQQHSSGSGHQQQAAPAGPNQQQQQQQQGGSIPTGYAAAVAGMRPPPPAEAVSAAAAMGRLRQLEEQQGQLEQQVSWYKDHVSVLEAAAASRDAVVAQLESAVALKDKQLAQQEAALSQKDAVLRQQESALAHKDRQLQELREQMAAQQQVTAQQQQLVAQQQQLSELRVLQTKTANELRAAQAANAGSAAAAHAGSRPSSKDGGSSSGEAGVGSSGRPRGRSVDLSSTGDALASSSSVVAGPSTTAAPWAAIAAGTAGVASSALRDSGTASSSGSQDLGLAAAAGAAPATPAGPPVAGHVQDQRSAAGSTSSSTSGVESGGGAAPAPHHGPLSYAESVSGVGHGPTDRQGPNQHQRHAAGGKAGVGPAGAAAHEPSGTPRAAAAGGALSMQSPGLTAVGPSSSLDSDSPAGPDRLNSQHSAAQAAQQQQQQHKQQQYGVGIPSTSNRPQERVGAAGAGKGVQPSGAKPSSYLSNGIAGVLHSSVPPTSSGSSSPRNQPAQLPSYRNAAAGAGGAGIGPSSLAELAGGAGAAGMRGLLGAGAAGDLKAGGAGGLAGKVAGGLAPQQQQHPFVAYAAAGGIAGASSGRPLQGFGPLAAAKGSCMDASQATQRSASTSSMVLDDAALDGFVHMHMIDDLLTE